MFWKEKQSLKLEMVNHRDIRPLETSEKFKSTEDGEVSEESKKQETLKTVSFIQLVSL